LEVRPEKIHAEDLDTLRTVVEYEFVAGTPSDFRNFFEINFQTGVVKQIESVSRESAREYNISVKATEVSTKRLSAESYVLIRVMAEDTSPPVLTVSSAIGYIDENSPVGNLVQDSNGNNITFKISDADTVSPNM
jgi:protocadherin-15